VLPLPKHVLDRWRGGAAAAGVPTSTITHTHSGTFTSTFRGTNGAVIYCDPGDGTGKQEKTLLGPGISVVFSYVNDGTERIVSVTGDIDAVSSVDISGNTISLYKNAFILLEILYIYDNNIIEISSLRKSSNLTLISARGNSIIDISPLVLLPLTTCSIYSNPVTYAGYTWSTANSGTFSFNSTVTTAAEVDRWLIDLNAASWSGCTIRLDGTNPARTTASDAAVAALVLRGCTLHLN